MAGQKPLCAKDSHYYKRKDVCQPCAKMIARAEALPVRAFQLWELWLYLSVSLTGIMMEN